MRSGGGYISQNDLRVHFGIGKAAKVDLLEIRWPSGQVDTMKDVKVNQLVYVKEGQGITRPNGECEEKVGKIFLHAASNREIFAGNAVEWRMTRQKHRACSRRRQPAIRNSGD